MSDQMLTDEQKAIIDAVRRPQGDILIEATAGSGKTFALIKALEVIPQRSVLVCAFNNKIADELKQRAPKPRKGSVFVIKTFHAIGRSILLHHYPKLQFDRNGTEAIINMAAGDRALAYPLRRAAVRVLRQAKETESHDGVNGVNLRAIELEIIGRNYDLFDELRDDQIEYACDVAADAYCLSFEPKNLTTVDFCDMIWMPIALGLTPPSRYQAIVVDEWQDMNEPQLELIRRLRAPGSGRLIMAGDGRQCIPKGQKIQTPNGLVPIEKVCLGDLVNCVYAGQIQAKPVIGISTTSKESAFEFDLGLHGKFRATKEHVCFAAVDDPRGAYVYLMYRRDLGYRLGVSSKSGQTRNNAILMRTQQERADRMWVLARCDSYEAAAVLEARWALTYSIPTLPFIPRPDSWGVDATQELFREFGANGADLLAAFGLDFERPNYLPKASSSARVAVNLLMATKDGHRVEVETNNISRELAQRLGFVRGKKRTWRLRRQFRSYSEARDLAELLTKELGGYLVESLSGTAQRRRMFAVRAASIHPGMLLPVEHNGRVISAPVLARKLVAADLCFDLEIDDAANFIVGNAIVHNSINGWRGAVAQTVRTMMTVEHKAQVLTLTTSFRCSEAVISEARQLVPKIKAAPGAPIGSVTYCGLNDVPRMIFRGEHDKIDTFILSRSNAPLLDTALYLWREGVRFQLNAGQEMLAPLFELLGVLDLRDPDAFRSSLEKWHAEQSVRADQLGSATLQERLDEHRSMLLAAVNYVAPSGLRRLFNSILEPGTTGVMLSTVHKVKGLEARRVFLLRETFKRHRVEAERQAYGDAQNADGTYTNLLEEGRKFETISEEDLNIEYVAITRAKEHLIWVDLGARAITHAPDATLSTQLIKSLSDQALDQEHAKAEAEFQRCMSIGDDKQAESWAAHVQALQVELAVRAAR